MPQQDKFPVQIKGQAIGELFFEELSCTERLNEPYSFELTALSEKPNLTAEKALGQQVTVLLDQPGGGQRAFNGLVSRLVRLGEQTVAGPGKSPVTLYRYQLRLQPWFWFLTRAADCRIFLNKSVKEIFEAVVKGHGFADYELKLNETYKQREYCVQYRESDFNFLSRLLEESGIRYFFRHEEGKHVMVLADRSNVHQHAPKVSEVAYRQTNDPRFAAESLQAWWSEYLVQPGTYVTTDFNFETPKTSLLKSSTHSRTHARSSFEVFDYPATPDVLSPDAVSGVAKIRLEELQTSYERFHGSGSHAGLVTGAKFSLKDHPDSAFNREYVITATEYRIAGNQYLSGQQGSFNIQVAVEALDSKADFRPPRITPKPLIQGAQTAMVVGGKNQEIDTDKYGRVKVQFPWDRLGKNDENSSCFVRVAQVWAGKSWGAIHIPRIGQEVLVSFLEGDPDRPIITGRVYNGESLPPYALPDNATQSGVKSRSSKQGAEDNYNEIRFEDKKGSELMLLHAEKDMTTEVEHDESVSVGHDSTTDIKHDRKLTVGNDSTTEIKHDRKLTIDHDETCTVKNDHSTSIGNNEKRDVTKKRTTTVGDDDELTVSSNSKSTISQKYSLTAGEEIVLQTGASKLVMKSDGTIELSGVSIKIQGNQSITQTGGQKIELSTMQFKLGATLAQVQGTSTSIQGTMLELQASGIASLKGSLTQIG